jgi:hypothetical protein
VSLPRHVQSLSLGQFNGPVLRGKDTPTSADAWYIHEDRLYLNYSRHVRSIWQKDIEGYVAKADNNWPGPLQA